MVEDSYGIFQVDSNRYSSRITSYPDISLMIAGYGINSISLQVDIAVIFCIDKKITSGQLIKQYRDIYILFAK
jgi:hypothetical protein